MKKQMPDLRLDEFVVIDFLEDDLDMEIFVEPAISTSAITCIHCGSPPTTENGSEERFFRDLNIYEKRVGVEVQSHRYKCKSCNRTFSLQYRCIGRKEKMTKRLKNTTQKKALHRTFTSVAQEYGLAAKSVENTFSAYADVLDRRPDVIAPRVLGLDECHLQKVMRPVHVDIENATILEMGRSVKKDDVIRDLMNFMDLDNVEVVATDMCNAYRSAIQYLIPNAIHVVDRFHVVQVFLKAVDYARHVIYETMKSDIAQIADPIRRDNEYRQLMDMKIDTFMFRKNPENMNDYRLFKYKEICEAYPEFVKPAWGRDNFMKIHDCDTLADAEAAYRNWKMLAPVHLDAYKKIKSFISHTMKNWRKEIFNYVVIDGKRKTNATTERLNGAIKICRTWGGATYIRFCGPKCFLAPRLLKSRFMNAY